MGVFTVIMGATLAGLSDVINGNNLIMSVATVNNAARSGMDLMVRDLLQVGSGLPASHAVTIPNGDNSQPVLIPGPPGVDTFETQDGDLVLPAVIPHANAGPSVNGVATDALTILMADNAFLDIALTATGASQVTVAAGPDLENGPDRVTPGQLMLISKGSLNTLVQVTEVDYGARVLTFADGDSMNLNQAGAEAGNLPALNAEEPVNDAAAMRISRLRMVSYYIDATEPAHPRLVRRINNGDPEDFDNTLGTAVALDVQDLQFTYDISNGENNPGGVEMNGDDLGTNGACSPNECAETQVRKINVMLKSRTPDPRRQDFITTTLTSQVSLRAMAFVDRYR
jgi:hypothetical protein